MKTREHMTEVSESAVLRGRQLRIERLIKLGLKLDMTHPSWSELLFEDEFRKDFPDRYRRVDKWRRQSAAHSKLVDSELKEIKIRRNE
jgi:hypothetical protein